MQASLSANDIVNMPAHTAIYTHSSMLKIFLLTHPREIAKVTNTGQLVIKALNCANSAKASAELILWSRTAPDPALLNSIATTPTLLLYPSEETLHNSSENNNPLADQQLPVSTTTLGQDRLDKATSVIVLDGTWQEVRKMYNKSHYLKSLNRLELASETQSRYQLRRNQKNSGLCTAESVIELLKLKQCTKCAETLDNLYSQFLIRMQKGRYG